jgi:hypothetical protein
MLLAQELRDRGLRDQQPRDQQPKALESAPKTDALLTKPRKGLSQVRLNPLTERDKLDELNELDKLYQSLNVTRQPIGPEETHRPTRPVFPGDPPDR